MCVCVCVNVVIYVCFDMFVHAAFEIFKKTNYAKIYKSAVNAATTKSKRSMIAIIRTKT